MWYHIEQKLKKKPILKPNDGSEDEFSENEDISPLMSPLSSPLSMPNGRYDPQDHFTLEQNKNGEKKVTNVPRNSLGIGMNLNSSKSNPRANDYARSRSFSRGRTGDNTLPLKDYHSQGSDEQQSQQPPQPPLRRPSRNRNQKMEDRIRTHEMRINTNNLRNDEKNKTKKRKKEPNRHEIEHMESEFRRMATEPMSFVKTSNVDTPIDEFGYGKKKEKFCVAI